MYSPTHAGLLQVARMGRSSCGTIVMDSALGFWIKVKHAQGTWS